MSSFYGQHMAQADWMTIKHGQSQNLTSTNSGFYSEEAKQYKQRHMEMVFLCSIAFSCAEESMAEEHYDLIPYLRKHIEGMPESLLIVAWKKYNHLIPLKDKSKPLKQRKEIKRYRADRRFINFIKEDLWIEK